MESHPSIDDLRLFCAVVQRGSFRAAAAHLGTSQPRISRAVKRLEDRLGRTLVRRNSRTVAPTPLGERYAAQAEELIRAFTALEATLLSEDQRVVPLSVSAPPALGRRLIVPALSTFCLENPTVRLALSLEAKRIDILEKGVDVAIRFGPLAATWQRQRRILRGKYHVYGSAKHDGAFEGLDFEQLVKTAPGLVLSATHLRDRWPLLVGGKQTWLPVNTKIVCDDMDALIRFTVAGLGITMVPDFLVRPEVERGELVQLTRERDALTVEVFAITSEQKRPRIVKAFIDGLVAGLA